MFGWLRSRRARARAHLEATARSPLLVEQTEFLLHEVRRLNERLRLEQLGDEGASLQVDRVQTNASFDYQWHEMVEGAALPSDESFMADLDSRLCEMTGYSAGWFVGKRVIDVGCGIGRFSYGLLSMGAHVTSCDQSEWALARTRELCAPFSHMHETRQFNLLEWDAYESFDLAFCFGVVHHTGNTYLAIRNVARKVGPGGRIFLMVYGLPRSLNDFRELNFYEEIRQELRLESFERRRQILIQRFGPDLAHGYFDAVSPKINDLLTFEEIGEALISLGLEDPRLTVASRNHHVIADRPA